MPTVVSTNDAIHPLDARQRIVLAFADLAKNDSIDVESIFKRVLLSGGGSTVTWGMLLGASNASTVTLSHSVLQDNTLYTVQVLPGIRSKRGRTLAKGGTYVFTTPIVDTSFIYLVTNVGRGAAPFIADANVCRTGKGSFTNQEEWYFTSSSHRGYYLIRNNFADTATALEAAASPEPCRLNPVGASPSAGMLWKLVPVTGTRSQYLLQNMSAGPARVAGRRNCRADDAGHRPAELATELDAHEMVATRERLIQSSEKRKPPGPSAGGMIRAIPSRNDRRS